MWIISVFKRKACTRQVCKNLWCHCVRHMESQGYSCDRCHRLKWCLPKNKGSSHEDFECRWILNTSWIKACQEAQCRVNEKSYEISLDEHGCHDGPTTGRLKASNNVKDSKAKDKK